MDPKPRLTLQTSAKQILSQALLHSLEILQMPQIELALLIQQEIEKNPLLELLPDRNPSSPFPDTPSIPTLYEHLSLQIKETIEDPAQQQLAQECISHLDDRGFFLPPHPTPHLDPLLPILQTFDPPGIFARTLQESLLIQLQRQGISDPLPLRLIEHTFTDLLQGRFSSIKKKLKTSDSDLSAAIQKLSRLSLRPASSFSSSPTQPIYPDLRLQKIDQQWIVEPIEDTLPSFRLRTEYLSLPDLSSPQKETLRSFTASAKWLLRSIQKRRKLLLSLSSYLVKKQSNYLNQKGPLLPLSSTHLAKLFNVHESTISRALSHKYLATPNGLLPLHSLVPSNSNEPAKEFIQRLISQENKQSPLTDDQIQNEMKKAGHTLARRTIAKYRKQLKIRSASQRKHLI